MGPAELEELLKQEPFTPVRLVLASGDVVLVERSSEGVVSGLTLILDSGSGTRVGSSTQRRLVSIPNICIVDRADSPPQPTIRRRR